MVFFNTVAPMVYDQPEWYAERGLSMDPLPKGPTGDYRVRQGRDPDQLIAELDTPERCQQYVRGFYEYRLWASEYSFDEDDFELHTAPFSDIRRLAAAWAPYQHEYGRPLADMPKIGRCEVPTMVLYGPEDRVVPSDFAKRCEIAFPNRVGPLIVPECGHFLQWERADILNPLVETFFAGLR